jgi:hypothetical protein
VAAALVGESRDTHASTKPRNGGRTTSWNLNLANVSVSLLEGGTAYLLGPPNTVFHS